MEKLDPHLVDHLLGFLGPKGAACLAATSPLFKREVEVSFQWRKWCYEDFSSLASQPARSLLEKCYGPRGYKGLYRELMKPLMSLGDYEHDEFIRVLTGGQSLVLLDVFVEDRCLLSQALENVVRGGRTSEVQIREKLVWEFEYVEADHLNGTYDIRALKHLIGLCSRSPTGDFKCGYTDGEWNFHQKLVTLSLKFLFLSNGKVFSIANSRVDNRVRSKFRASGLYIANEPNTDPQSGRDLERGKFQLDDLYVSTSHYINSRGLRIPFLQTSLYGKVDAKNTDQSEAFLNDIFLNDINRRWPSSYEPSAISLPDESIGHKGIVLASDFCIRILDTQASPPLADLADLDTRTRRTTNK